jgi:hypothetical protein
VAGKSIKAPEKGRTETILAKLFKTAVTINADTKYPATHPAEPETLIDSPGVTKMPIPTVLENAIPVRCGRKGAMSAIVMLSI